jgi:hypothetical protein
MISPRYPPVERVCERFATSAAAASNPDPAPFPDLNWFWQKVARVEVKLEELAALVQGERATVGGEGSVTCNVKRCTS